APPLLKCLVLGGQPFLRVVTFVGMRQHQRRARDLPVVEWFDHTVDVRSAKRPKPQAIGEEFGLMVLCAQRFNSRWPEAARVMCASAVIVRRLTPACRE